MDTPDFNPPLEFGMHLELHYEVNHDHPSRGIARFKMRPRFLDRDPRAYYEATAINVSATQARQLMDFLEAGETTDLRWHFRPY